MAVTKESFGRIADGREASLYTLSVSPTLEVKVTDYGATLVAVLVQDKNEHMTDVVLGYDDAAGYEQGHGHFGAIVGRSGNRIDHAQFELNGKVYHLKANTFEHNLHSGDDYFGKRLWTEEEVTEDSVTFSLFDADMQQGYPGNFTCHVTYKVQDEGRLSIHYLATSDQDTVANMTNHVYFNLDGHDQGNVHDQELMIRAEAYTPVSDHTAIPTGELAPVEGTPMDFRTPHTIGARIDADFEQMKMLGGYDHNYVIKKDKGAIEKIAEAYSPKTGICLTAYTDLPGVQFYAGNSIGEGTPGKGGAVYNPRSGFCLETQYFPNSINQEGFASPVLKAGDTYDTTTIYKFWVR